MNKTLFSHMFYLLTEKPLYTLTELLMLSALSLLFIILMYIL